MDFCVVYCILAAVSTLCLNGATYIFLRLRQNQLPWSHLLTRTIATSSILYLGSFTCHWNQMRYQQPCGQWHSKEVSNSECESSKGDKTPRLNVQRFWIISFLMNAVCILFLLDFLYRAESIHPANDLSFHRMGWTNATSALIVLRAPQHQAVRLEYSAAHHRTSDDAEIWSSAAAEPSLSDNDYVVQYSLPGLQPDTRYGYRTDLGHHGSFATPMEHPKWWSMISSSCMKSFFPYNPFDHSLGIHGLRHLSDFVRVRNPEFVLFLGDFIYVDLPVRHGWSREHYKKAYRQVYASPSWDETLTSLPWIHAYDDHEISNNWSSNVSGVFEDAIGAFSIFHHSGNPPPHRKDRTYYSFAHGDVSFFVLDTRRYRSCNSLPDGPDKTMLGAEQLADLQEWLQSAPGWKVVASSVPFTRNFRSPDANDSWAGYLWERQQILQTMWKTGGALILSGDRHEHATTDFGGGVIEFSTSPLSQFYEPFRRDYQQVENLDRAIFHRRKGHSKFASFTFDTRESVWKMEMELIVDGRPIWNYTIYRP